jgi:hypothetical protein
VPVQADDLHCLGVLLRSEPRSDEMNMDISIRMPMLTCTPWKPVRVKNADENGLVV